MSKATALHEIPKLAEASGFVEMKRVGNTVYHANRERLEGITLNCDETGAFVSALWHAPDEYRTIVDKRAPGEFGKEGRSLSGTDKRRPVGMDDVHPVAVTSIYGLEVGYLELKRRIKNVDWKNS